MTDRRLRSACHRDVRIRTRGIVLWDNYREVEVTLSDVNDTLHFLLVAVADLAGPRGGQLGLRAARVTPWNYGAGIR